MPYVYLTGTSTSGSSTLDLRIGKLKDNGNYDERDLYRGNTSLVKDNFRKCYYAITHKVIPPTETSLKTYVNYVVEYDRNLVPIRISKPFKLTDKPIEFVTALNEMPNGELVIGVTEMDETPFAMVFDKDEFLMKVNKDD